jgi:hypothetical protein
MGASGWFPVMGIVLTDDQIDRILTLAERALVRHAVEQGKSRFALPAHIVTGTKR